MNKSFIRRHVLQGESFYWFNESDLHDRVKVGYSILQVLNMPVTKLNRQFVPV